MFVIFYSFLAFFFWLFLLLGYLFDFLSFVFIFLASLFFLALLRCGFRLIINSFSLQK